MGVIAQQLVRHCGAGRTLQEALERDGLAGWPPTRGRTFHVETELGGPSNSGERADDALDSITAAIALCEANRRDKIVIHRWSTDNDETWPLPMTKAGVTLLGMRGGGLNHFSKASIICPDNTAVITISATDCRIVNCYLQCPASYDAIAFSGTPGRTGIFGNWFATCQDAIGGGAGASTSIGYSSEIGWNFFEARIARRGIFQYNPAHLFIHDNLFSKVGGDRAILLDRCGRPIILRNKFALLTDVDGAAIHVGSSTHGLIDDNRAGAFGTIALANVPYADNQITFVNANSWGMNYRDIRAVLPVSAISF